ncbi:MAG: EamA family transporter RarD [Bacteriovoracaceae bacterium]
MKLTRAHLAAMLAFTMWGLFPIYWKYFSEVSAWDLFGHRLLWSFITLTLVMTFRKKLYLVKEIWRDPKKRIMLIMSSLLISSNWLLYIYAVNNGRILEASMGYFLNPLLNVFMGWLILKENLRPTQWPAILLALVAIGILAITTDMNHFPWLALLLSITFALYGLIRKIVHVGSMEGLLFETMVVVVPVIAYWFTQPTRPSTVLEILPLHKNLVLTLAGVVTSLPLILFAYGTKRLSLQTLGMIQYLSPSFKFICGLFIFHEALNANRLLAFCIIWAALAWYTVESYRHARRGLAKVVNE